MKKLDIIVHTDVSIREIQLNEETRRYYRYFEHKHVRYVESSFRFLDYHPIYWMRCICCRDLLAWVGER